MGFRIVVGIIHGLYRVYRSYIAFTETLEVLSLRI